MSDLISRSKLIEELQKCFVNNSIHKNNLAEILANLPTVEAKPVVHGKWVHSGLLFEADYCSICTTPIYNTEGMNFCPNCGADMREKE